jgi:hypothetical protein
VGSPNDCRKEPSVDRSLSAERDGSPFSGEEPDPVLGELTREAPVTSPELNSASSSSSTSCEHRKISAPKGNTERREDNYKCQPHSLSAGSGTEAAAETDARPDEVYQQQCHQMEANSDMNINTTDEMHDKRYQQAYNNAIKHTASSDRSRGKSMGNKVSATPEKSKYA